MLQQNIWHIAKYQDNKNHPKFVETAKYCKPKAQPGGVLKGLKHSP